MNPSRKYITIGIIVILAIAISSVIAVGELNIQSTDENNEPNSVVGVLDGAEDNLDHKLVYSIREVPSTFESSTAFFSRNQYPDDMYIEVSIDSQPSDFDVSLPGSTETFDVDGGETAYEDIPLTISNLPSSISSGVLKDHVTFQYEAYWSENDELYDTDTFDHPIHLVDIKNAEVIDNINFDDGEIPSNLTKSHDDDEVEISVSDNYSYSESYSLKMWASLIDRYVIDLLWESPSTVENGYVFLKLFDDERNHPRVEKEYADRDSYIEDDEDNIIINRDNQMIVTLNSWRQVGAQIDVGYQNKLAFKNIMTVGDGFDGEDSIYIDDILVVEESD